MLEVLAAKEITGHNVITIHSTRTKLINFFITNPPLFGFIEAPFVGEPL